MPMRADVSRQPEKEAGERLNRVWELVVVLSRPLGDRDEEWVGGVELRSRLQIACHTNILVVQTSLVRG